jgi:hypothetical protein
MRSWDKARAAGSGAGLPVYLNGAVVGHGRDTDRDRFHARDGAVNQIASAEGNKNDSYRADYHSQLSRFRCNLLEIARLFRQNLIMAILRDL